jgi:hypothetical protein
MSENSANAHHWWRKVALGGKYDFEVAAPAGLRV